VVYLTSVWKTICYDPDDMGWLFAMLASPPVLNINIRCRKVKTCRFSSGTWLCYNLLRLVKRPSNAMQLVEEKSVINMIRLLLPVSDWSNIMIGPGGLQPVVLTYLLSEFHFLWVGFHNSK